MPSMRNHSISSWKKGLSVDLAVTLHQAGAVEYATRVQSNSGQRPRLELAR